MEDEKYLGGFSSASLRKGIASGYGIYATSRRFFGIYDRLARPGPIFPGKPPGHNLMGVLAKQGSATLIRELERRKDIEIRREEISKVEIRKPSWVRRGRIIIALNAGGRVNLWILEDRDFGRARELFRKFCPEVMSVA